MQALTSWHSPYKALLNCENLQIDDKDEIREEFGRLDSFLKGFFLRKAACFPAGNPGATLLPWELCEDEDRAAAAVGIRLPKESAGAADFRGNIQLENHFQHHVMECSFRVPVRVDKKEQVETLKQKIMNNLMQWHSGWNLLIDCTHLEVDAAMQAPVENMLASFKPFFLKKAIGYSPIRRGEPYPFKVHLSRHQAAGQLEAEGLISGDKAVCQSEIPVDPKAVK